ncbi:MAG: glycosyltransferase family 4 protein [Elusimicrobia bacterium]|nr:glycosyltransferase family 4 protein [Elusimicrobiota bacterium]
MNILHIEDEPWDSGIAHYALTLAAEQARRGHRVEFWGRADSPVLTQARALGLPVRGFSGGAPGLLHWPEQRRLCAKFAPRVINAHTGSAHALAVTLASGRPAAVVRTRGDARPASPNVLTRAVAGRTDAFIAANTELGVSIKSAFPEAKVARVPQGIDGPAHATFLPAAPIVGMIARFDKVKGHEILIDAAARLKSAVPGLKVRCAGEGKLLQRLSWQLKPAGLEGVVDFPGRVADKWAFLASCRIGVVPSLGSEAVSRATLEWMALGRPVVASRVGGIPDMVEDGVTGLLVEPGDSAALREAIHSLLKDPKLAERLGRAGRASWEQSFGLDQFYETTQRVYNEATAHLPL